MFKSSQIAAILKRAGIPPQHAVALGNLLGNTQQKTTAGPEAEQDTTPRDMRSVTPDARRHHLTNLDFRRGDPDHHSNKIDDSESKREPQPDPAVKRNPAPQETEASYCIVDGKYTQVAPDGESVAIDLAVQGNGRAMMLDPPSNSIIGKTLRCEAGGGGANQSLVRFFIDETGQEIVWKLQLNIERFPIVRDIQYKRGRGIEYTVQTAAVFFDPTDRPQQKLIRTYEQEVVADLDKNVAGTDLIATKVKVDVLDTKTLQPDTFTFGGGDGKVRLCKTAADWTKGTSATLAVYAGTPLAEAATGESITAYNLIGKVLSGQWVFCAKADNGFYYLIEAEKTQNTAVWSVEIVGTTVAGVTTSNLVFHRRKFWTQAVETDTDVTLPLTECVTPYSGSSGGTGGY